MSCNSRSFLKSKSLRHENLFVTQSSTGASAPAGNTRSEERTNGPMYEASEVIALGAANEMIQGTKPWAPDIIDSEFIEEHQNRLMDDIDEDE